MISTLRNRVSLVLGVLMLLIGLMIPVSTFLLRRRPVSGSAGLDLAFAIFFALRGYLNIRRGRWAPPHDA